MKTTIAYIALTLLSCFLIGFGMYLGLIIETEWCFLSMAIGIILLILTVKTLPDESQKTLGPIVNSVNGLHIRQMLDSKGKHNGQFDIYAGKKLFKEYTTVADAILVAQKSTSNKPSHFPFRNAFLKWRDKK